MSATTLRKSTNAQVQRLQSEIESMVRDTIAPTVADIVAPAVNGSNQVREYSDTVAVGIGHRPLISVLAAAAIGFFAGRITAGLK